MWETEFQGIVILYDTHLYISNLVCMEPMDMTTYHSCGSVICYGKRDFSHVINVLKCLT